MIAGAANLRSTIRERFIAWATRRQTIASHPIDLHHRRIYILPTRYGYYFAMILLLMLLTAMNYGNSMGFALTFLLAGLGGGALWQTHRNLLQLRIRFVGAEPVFAGQPARFQLSLDNPSSVIRHGLYLHYRSRTGDAVTVPAQGSAVLNLDLDTTTRGILRPGRFSLYTVYPLGLFKAWSWLQFDMAAVVYPHPIEYGALETDINPVAAGKPTNGEGQGDFMGLRDYRQHDSLKHLAWKAMARTDALYTKQFSNESASTVWLDIEAYAPHDVERRLGMLCHAVLEAHRLRQKFGLRLHDTVIEPVAGGSHLHRCLEALARHGGDDRRGSRTRS